MFKMIKSTACVTAVALGLSACAGGMGQAWENVDKTVTYGTAAAAAGGLIGKLSHGSKGARNTAIVLGALGAGVGAYMDAQEAKLRQATTGTGVEVVRTGDNQIKLTIPENVTFATGRYDLSPQAQNALNGLAQTLATYTDTKISIIGHTDSTGSDAINNPLSVNRAQSVAQYLGSRGVAYNRMSTMGQGSRNPIADNATDLGRAQNRRVEVLVNASPNS